MRAVMGLCTLVATLAVPAMAISIPEVCFEDNFDSYPENTPLAQAWGGAASLPELLIKSWGPPGNKAVRMRGQTGTGSTADAWTVQDFSACVTGKVQVLQFTLESDLDHQSNSGSHLTIMLNDEFGAEMGRWYGCSYAVRPRYGGSAGTAVNICDGEVHLFTMVYDPVTGDAEWLHNDSPLWSCNIGAGRACARIWVQDISRDTPDWVWLDDVALGAPEPVSLTLLGLGGLFLVRRRRA